MPFIYAVLILLAAFFLIIGIRIFNSTKFVGTDAGIGKIISSFTLKGVFTVLFIISGITIFFWKLYTPGLQSSQVGSWSWNRWPWILVLWGIGYGLIAFNAKTLGKATGTLQNILTTVAISLLVLGLFTSQCSGPRMVPPPPQANTTTIPLAYESRLSWQLILPPGGKSELIRVSPDMRLTVNGRGADLHTVYEDGHESVIPVESNGSNPAGKKVGSYVTNRLQKTNVVYCSITPN